MKEKLERKEKDIVLANRQKDNHRAQLGSVIEMWNAQDSEASKNQKVPQGDILPSLQNQLQAMQEEGKFAE